MGLLQCLDFFLDASGVFWRSSAAFISVSPESLANQACDKRRAQRRKQPRGGRPHGRVPQARPGSRTPPCQAGFQRRSTRVALTVTHTHFCGLLGNRLVREHTDPDAATTLDVAGNRTACGFDLAGRQAAAVSALETKITEGYRVATGSDAGVAALCSLRYLRRAGCSMFILLYRPLLRARLCVRA